MSERTVLVVDDEPLIRMALADVLEDEGYMVLEASSVIEAMGVLATHPQIDAVVTDVDMPGPMDGFDLMRLVATKNRRAAIVVASGGRSPAENELSSGCRFFAKPYCMEDMVRELDRQCQSRRAFGR